MAEKEMDLTQVMVEEHRLIKKVIDVLEAAAAKLENDENVEPEFFDNAVDFIRNFADGFHHAKEEDILFRGMVKKGMPEKDSPIEVMLIEHDLGRDFVKGMIEANGRFRKNRDDRKAAADIVRNARGYISLLREHIEKENEILYPLAERMFTKKEKDRIKKEFSEAEEKKGGMETVRKYEGLYKRLNSNIMKIRGSSAH